MIPLRKSTASQEVLLGPFLDDTDGKTAETGLTIASTDIKLWKRGGTTEADKNSGGATHIAGGRYYAVLDATDTDTVGELIINVAVAGALPVRLVCCVFEATVFDALFASGAAGYQVPIWSSASATVNLSATTIKAVTDAVALPASASINITGNITGDLSGSVGSVVGAVGSVTGAVGSVTGAVGSVTGSVGSVATGGITAASFAAGAIDASAIAADAIGSSELAASAVTEIASGVRSELTTELGRIDATISSRSSHSAADVWSVATRTLTAFGFSVSIGSGGITSSSFAAGAIDAAAIAADAIGSAELAASAVTEIASGVRTELATELARIDAATSSRSSHSAADVWSVATRTLTAFGFSVTVGTNNDKTGYSLTQAFPSNFASMVISAGGVANANVTQWNGGSLPTIGTSTLTAADVWTYAVSRTLTTTIPTADAIADAVWDEAYAGHTTAGSFGKLLDTLRKSNYVTDGTVAAGQTPTTTVFRSGLTAPTGTFDHQTILFLTGALTGESRPIDTYLQTNGTFTLAEPLTSAPAVGDEFVLLPDHVHPITAIAAGVRAELATELALIDDPVSSRLATSGYVAPDNTSITAIKAKTDNLPASPAAVSDIPTAITVADAVLGRSVATVQATAAEWSLCTLVLAALESSIVGSTWTIYRTDGTTPHFTKAITTDSAAEPVTGVS